MGQLEALLCYAFSSLFSSAKRWRFGTVQRLGRSGERVAARYLRRRGFCIVAERVCSTWGEIDLVAIQGRTVVFVEVKTRSSDAYGQPEEAVTYEKQRRLTRLALAFLSRHDLLNCKARFDVVSVLWSPQAWFPQIHHIQDAFQPTERFQMFV